MKPLPFIVALTGGIASGKSTIASRFAALGASVLDADLVARELVLPGSPALTEIVARFGTSVLDANGALDRRAMRVRVFADADVRRSLEAILHPRIRATLQERARFVEGPYVLLVIPLLTEGGRYDWVDRVLVVDASRDAQCRRLLVRDGITTVLAYAMLDAQASREERLAVADDVIANDATLTDLYTRIAELHANYVLWGIERRTH
jgi:dephospho-CoA kinase